MPSPDAITPLVHVAEFSSFGADIDLRLAANGAPAGTSAARYIEVISAGSGGLVLKGPTGNTITLSGLVQGDRLPIQATVIVSSGTTVTKVRVGW
jgi:hypothetical protein